MSELLVALIVVPLVAAVLPVLLAPRFERSGWPITALVLALHATLTATLVLLVHQYGTVSHAIGGFAPPFGIELVADGLSIPFVALVSGSSLALLGYTRLGGPRSNPVYSLYLLLVAGLTGVCITGDAFTLYVFLEISGIAAYGLVARGSGGAAALAALKYLLLGTVGATFYLLGVGYLYLATGTLNMLDVAAQLPHDSRLALAAFAFIAIGLAAKMALYPLHVWQPDAYEHAPTAVTALLSALVSTVAGYALIRLVFGVFTTGFLTANPFVGDAILILGAGSVLAGGALAFREPSVKRVFAYSSVAQFGLAALGIGLATVPAVLGAVLQLLGHAVMKGGLFAGAGVIASRTDAQTFEGYGGVSASTPWASGSIAVIGLGMVGIPPTVGFVAKWYLAVGAIDAGAWPVLAVILVSTLISLLYFGRLVQTLYTEPRSEPATPAQTEPTTQAQTESTTPPQTESTTPPQTEPATPPGTRVSTGMRSVAVGAAVATVVLGFGAVGIASFVEPAIAPLFP